MAPAQAYDVRGNLEVREKLAVGWCWSQQRPKEALRVELLLDGKVIASGVAARLVLDLVRPGVTDGYHGFLLILPKALPENGILEAREVQTGHVFARQLPKVLPDVTDWYGRIGKLGSGIEALHENLHDAKQSEKYWQTAWASTGSRLSRKSPVSSTLALRRFAEPLWTIILDLPRVENLTEARARQEILQLAPLVAYTCAELLVIDDGRVNSFLLGTHGLRSAPVAADMSAAARLNVAMQMATGKSMAIFAPIQPGLRPPNDILGVRANLLATPPDLVTIGGGSAASIYGVALDVQFALIVRPLADSGILLLTPRDDYETVGALDEATDDGNDLALVDWGIRAHLTGKRIQVFEPLFPVGKNTPIQVENRKWFLEKWKSVNHISS